MFLSEWLEFPSAPCLAGGGGKNLTARVAMLLKLRASLTCLRACFLPGRAKDLSAPSTYQTFVLCRWDVRFLCLFPQDCNSVSFRKPKLPKHSRQCIFLKLNMWKIITTTLPWTRLFNYLISTCFYNEKIFFSSQSSASGTHTMHYVQMVMKWISTRQKQEQSCGNAMFKNIK